MQEVNSSLCQISYKNEAIRESEFVLYLQPQFLLDSNTICGAEILLRWNHPEKGLLVPEQFFAEFAEKGLLYDLDSMVLEKACQLLKEWKIKGFNLIPLAVNLFGKTPFRPQWTQWLKFMMNEYGVDSSFICLEIKEDSYTGSPRATHALVSELQSVGIQVALDNFGNDNTSLKTLNGMGTSMLKADMKFLDYCSDLGTGEVLLSAMIHVAKWMGMTVVAEHVQSRQQKDVAVASGCIAVQGSFCADPVSSEEFEKKYLPLVQTHMNDMEKAAEEIQHQRQTILVVDDSELERDLVKKYLADEFHLEEAESAEQAIAYLNSNSKRVQLILIDNVMPGMSGMDFLHYCQNVKELQMIPKIMITSNERPKDQIEAFRAGAYDYLNKPLIPEVVQARVHHVMNLNMQLRETELEEERFRHQAETDKATGLLNKATFEEMTREYLLNTRAEECALIIIDVDNFKSINDKYGHLHGDEVLKVIANELQHSFRKTDYVGRFGGDEFIVCLTSNPKSELVKQKTEQILQNVNSICSRDLQIQVTLSIGTGFCKEKEEFEELFKRVDEALYTAKKEGKGRVVMGNL